MAKPLIIFIVITFVAGALYIGGASFFGGGDQQLVYASVATVNGQPISEYELQNAYYQELQYYQSTYGQVTPKMLESIRYSAYDMLVYDSLIQQAINEHGFAVNEDEVNAEVEAFKKEIPSEMLREAGYSDDYLVAAFTQQLQYEKLIELITGEIDISDEVIKDMYEQVEASHILIRVDSDDQVAWDEAAEYGEFILSELEFLDFAEAAAMYSVDSSASQGGSIGYVSRGDTVEAFNDAIFSMEVGEVSGLVKTEFGYHIIKVTNVRSAEGEEFEATKLELKEQLFAEERSRLFSNWLTEAREQADIVLDDQQLVAFELYFNGDYEAAVAAYQVAIEDESDNGYLYSSLGDVYLELEQIEAATTAYEQAVELVPNDGSLVLILATLYEDDERNDDAIATYVKASELLSYDYFALSIISSALTSLGDEEAAAAVNDKIAAMIQMYDEAQAEEMIDLEELELELEQVTEEVNEENQEATTEE